MKLHLTILGCGTMVPTKERNSAAFLLDASGIRILLDCGHGTLQRMVRFGINPHSIDAVFISHFHTDHFGGVPGFIHARFVENLYLKAKDRELLLAGPENLQKNFLSLRKVFWPEPTERVPLKFREGPQNFKLKNIRIEVFRVHHVPWFKSVGFRIRIGKKIIVYTGDIGSRHPFDDFVAQAKNADLLITEASHEQPTPNHFSVAQVLEIIQRAHVKKTLMVHVPYLFVKRAKQLIAGHKNIVLGKDGLTFSI